MDGTSDLPIHQVTNTNTHSPINCQVSDLRRERHYRSSCTSKHKRLHTRREKRNTNHTANAHPLSPAMISALPPLDNALRESTALTAPTGTRKDASFREATRVSKAFARRASSG